MKTIIVAGASSKSGKTALAEALLHRLPRQTWGGVKITVTHDIFGEHPHNSADSGVCESATSGYRIISDPEIIERPNTDTGRLVRAGAGPVLWAITTPSFVPQVWEDVQHRLREAAGVIVESTSLALCLKPDITFLTINPRTPRDRWKTSATVLMAQCDFVIISLYDADREPAQRVIDQIVANRRGRGVIVTESIEHVPDWPELQVRLRALL